MYDTEYADLFGMPPLDIEAFLRGDAQGRDRAMSGADAALARKYLKSWHMPAEDYERRREALGLQQYSYFGNCPRCEAEGAIYSLPYPYGKSDWLVCSEGCEVRWCFGSGHFRAYTPDDLSEQEELAIVGGSFIFKRAQGAPQAEVLLHVRHASPEGQTCLLVLRVHERPESGDRSVGCGLRSAHRLWKLQVRLGGHDRAREGNSQRSGARGKSIGSVTRSGRAQAGEVPGDVRRRCHDAGR